jgi:hypothetical protein
MVGDVILIILFLIAVGTLISIGNDWAKDGQKNSIQK